MIAKLRYFINHLRNTNATINQHRVTDTNLRYEYLNNRDNAEYCAQLAEELNQNDAECIQAIAQRNNIMKLFRNHIENSTDDLPAREWFAAAGLSDNELHHLFYGLPYAHPSRAKLVPPSDFNPWQFAGLR